jgi:hypothetical protein
MNTPTAETLGRVCRAIARGDGPWELAAILSIQQRRKVSVDEARALMAVAQQEPAPTDSTPPVHAEPAQPANPAPSIVARSAAAALRYGESAPVYLCDDKIRQRLAENDKG